MDKNRPVTFKEKFENIRSIFYEKESILLVIISSSALGLIMFRYTYFEATYHNIGHGYAIMQSILQIMLSVLFGLNVAMLWHKLKFTTRFSAKEAHATTISAIFGVIVSGCPACGLTLASYLGLASFFASFPLFGMELKMIGIALLLFSIDSLAKNMYVCEIKAL